MPHSDRPFARRIREAGGLRPSAVRIQGGSARVYCCNLILPSMKIYRILLIPFRASLNDFVPGQRRPGGGSEYRQQLLPLKADRRAID